MLWVILAVQSELYPMGERRDLIMLGMGTKLRLELLVVGQPCPRLDRCIKDLPFHARFLLS